VPVGVCGEMGGRTLEAMALIGLGLRRLSITPTAIGSVKAMIRSIDTRDLEAVVQPLVRQGNRDIRQQLTEWAEGQGVELGV